MDVDLSVFDEIVDVAEPDIAILAYLAGFFDGEGCITTQTGNGVSLRVTAAQIDPAPLLLLQRYFGGHVYPPYGSNSASTWVVSAREGTTFLKAVGPLLLVKRRQAELALQMQEADFERRRFIATELKRLKGVHDGS